MGSVWWRSPSHNRCHDLSNEEEVERAATEIHRLLPDCGHHYIGASADTFGDIVILIL